MNLDLFSRMHLKMLHCRFLEIQWLESGELMIVMRHNGALKWREASGRVSGDGWKGERTRWRVVAAATGKRASCLFKKRQQPPKPLSASAWAMLMRLVLVGWLSIESPGDWRQAVGEGLGVDDSWDPVSQEQANRERGRKKKTSNRGRARRG